MEAKFDFYEVVSFLSADAVPLRLQGTSGVIVGRSQSDRGTWEYAVQAFSDEGKCWQFEEQLLRSQGQKMSREELYSGETLKVRVDPISGKGSAEE